MSFRNALDEARHQRNVLMAVCALAFILAFFNGIGWLLAGRALPVLDIPPDLTQGARIHLGERHPANVYAFAHYIWQQLNHWPQDGSKDYGERLQAFSPYLTPRFQQELVFDLRRRARDGELHNRVRFLQEIPGRHYAENRVDSLGNGVWRVWLDVAINEHVNHVPVKDRYIRYPLRVVEYDIDRALNPYGLALDGFTTQHGPIVIPDEDIAKPIPADYRFAESR